jgi:hypothetical protein
MAAANPSNNDAKKKPRGQSGTAYTYFDLDFSIKVADAIHTKGGGAGTPDQIAAWLGYKSTRSGTYLTRIANARQFGVVVSNGDEIAVTDRGRTILAPVMPEDSINAKVDAFLSVELFAKVYEQFKGTSLPPEAGLKNLFIQTYKILPERAPHAVRAFLSSAEQAGFFRAAGDKSRLIKPSIRSTSPASAPTSTDAAEKEEPPVVQHDRVRSHTSDGPAGVHFAIVGLLRDLPPPGTKWHPKKKQRFLDAFKAAIDFIYPEEDEE